MSAPAMEHLDVLVIGAGLSGIGAAHHLQTDSPWATYAVFEAREAIGGTWDLFRYPGIRSDSDMYTLGYPFRPWTNPDGIGDGASIRQYIEDTATEAGIDRHIRFQHKVLRIEWSTDEARWHVLAARTDTHETVELTCNFVLSCTGYYRYDHGHDPEFPGRADFRGQIIHPQFWPDDLDYAGKRIVVIGSGATAITLIPSLTDKAAHVTMLQRSPTYIASVPRGSPIARGLQRVLPKRVAGDVMRWFMALFTQGSFQLSRRRPALMKRLLRKGLERELPPGYDIDRHFTPSYDPWDQRLCVVPEGDLFKAISSGQASVVTDHIERFTETGIALKSGEELPADIIVTATGLEVLFLGGMELVVDGEKVEPHDKFVYKGMMLEDVPNLGFAIGYANASWTLKCDLTLGYACRLLNHLRETGQRQCMPVNREPSMGDASVFGLSSGYLQRAEHVLPRSGDRYPWQVHQSYLRDYRATKRSELVDGVMQFSNRAPFRAASSGASEPAATAASSASVPA